MEEQPSGVRSRFKRAADKDDGGLSRIERLQRCNELDRKFGYEQLHDSSIHLGWLINMHPGDLLDEERRLVSAVDFYFVQEDGDRFKVTMPYQPYFYIATTKDNEREVASFLSKKLSGRLAAIDMVDKEDLDLANHLVGIQATYLKLRFHSVEDLMKAKRDIMPAVKKNKEKEKSLPVYDPTLFTSRTDNTDMASSTTLSTRVADQMENIIDIREYDVPYHVRVAIDLKINVGHWYNVRWRGLDPPELSLVEDEPDRPEPVVMAYDIETTKLPLKFPDPAIDCIMMISYMIDAQGYLLINREVVSADVENFEYTPKPEFEGYFTVFNEPDEVSLLKHFISHILEVRPNIIVTYNGDAFDWPFLDSRCSFHGISLVDEVGFSPDAQDEYKCRPIIHMDAFRWVKRDSYLPVGSQNLKAAAKAKLRYAPVELDPEEMCRMASENPQVLANYSVSDAVATYYLYMKYVHPFIFALCTIIPMEPDEVLRKGSGTLCEALLMVQAFHGNIIFPNRQEAVFGKLTSDGHLLDQETYVGGHVEAIEAGVFRSDLPCRFKLNTETVADLMGKVGRTIKHAVEVEEKIPLSQVTNYDEVCNEIVAKLSSLRDHPIRSENPMIYHLDVGAMYPNIILTNRLQPSAIVDEATCAACDFNKPESQCQRKMNWSWRGDFLPASRSEYHHIKHQLEAENIPGESPGDPPRSFHSLPPVEQARLEKKRLAEYCRKAYRRVKVTREEQRVTTVCQRENSFYVDTVRAFRDRRYRFKGLLKQWRKKLDAAKKSGDPAEIKSCQNKEILYDSLQLAHKCILNSFYGYVMRKGARWYSMEMAGIVCHTGANIITMAREVVENIGRPLELDTDGIWCVLPASFPENYKLNTTNPSKKSVMVCYPGAMLNMMVQDHFTNDQYQELVDHAKLEYTRRSENSIFFEVDGPYRAMILPASKEEGKKLKKRYAVFNDDGSLAELKGFEVKRRGELQLVKNFQSSVFEAFLRGGTLQECYQSVAQVADFWLDVLYSQAEHMPDSELFDLISENRNMSRKLEEYGELKSTSISTAKRLAEFLGDQMVKDAGLSCRYIISRKPEGAPVTERAIPLAIFQAESSVRQYYLRKWLKSSHADNFDIRSILDWNYYIERLGSAVQKIITIPAAMQGVANPVPRVKHPDWLHKRLLEKNDVFRQKQILDMFPRQPKRTVAESGGDDMDVTVTPSQKKRPIEAVVDMEDIGSVPRPHRTPIVSKNKIQSSQSNEGKSWREVLGSPPPRGITKKDFANWLAFHKKKWEWQRQQRKLHKKGKSQFPVATSLSHQASQRSTGGLTGFLRRRANVLVENPWQIIQIKQTASLGMFTLWALIGDQLHRLSLEVPRIFYVNSYITKQLAGEGQAWRRVSRALPHSSPTHHLYQYSVSEEVFQRHMGELAMQLSAADIEGVYETQVPLLFRAIITMGCVCTVAKDHVKTVLDQDLDVFQLNQLQYRTLAHSSYLDSNCLHRVYLYHSNTDSRSLFAVYLSSLRKISLFIVDRVRNNAVPNMTTLYQSERNSRLSCYGDDYPVPEEDISFDVRVDVDQRLVCRAIHRLIADYRDQRRGPSLVLLQSPWAVKKLSQLIPSLEDFPQVIIPSLESDNQYPTLDWQRVASRKMIRQLLNLPSWLQNQLESCRYSLVPIGNMATDQPLFISDVFYTRHLTQHNHLIWCSPTNQPDLGGHESDDYRLATESGRGIEINESGAYPTACIEFALDGLAVTTVYKSHMINEYEGVGSTASSLDSAPQISLEEMMSGTSSAQGSLTVYDESALCSGAFKILRSLVGAWLQEVMTNHNYFADLQLQHFYRWLHTPSVLLYEPSLCRVIHGLMKKLFLQLIAEFKHLGSTIVYANYNKIIVCTKKKSIEDACAYARFILDSIRSKELFKFLTIEPTACWTYLMWMDQANNGGIRGKLPKEFIQHDPNVTMDDDDDDDEMGHVEMNWMIAKFLPKACQQLFQYNNKLLAIYHSTWSPPSRTVYTSLSVMAEGNGFCVLSTLWFHPNKLARRSLFKAFQVVIAGHISAVYQHLSNVGQLATPNKRTQSSQSQGDAATMATLVTFCQHRITNELTEQLYMIIQKVHQNIGRHSDSNMEAPALQLVKYICKVLSLDPGTQHQVAKLRRDLLQLIGVKEFSSEAIYVTPGYSYVLPEVICDSCNHCRDVDLCRDPCIQPDETTGRSVWQCSHCGSEYNTMVIEQRLVEAVQQLSLSDVLQDVECARCHGVKEANISDYCRCAGEFCNTTSSDKLLDQLIMFDTIARCEPCSYTEDIGLLQREENMYKLASASADIVTCGLILLYYANREHDMMLLADCVQWILTVNQISLPARQYITTQ